MYSPQLSYLCSEINWNPVHLDTGGWANGNIFPRHQKADFDVAVYNGFSLSWHILHFGYQPCVVWWTGTENCTSTFSKRGLGFSLHNSRIPSWVMKLNSQTVLKIVLVILTLYVYSCTGEFTFTIDCLIRTKAYKVKTKLLSMHLEQDWWQCLFCIALLPARPSCRLDPSHVRGCTKKALNGHTCVILLLSK